jgi:hypothetical protein
MKQYEVDIVSRRTTRSDGGFDDRAELVSARLYIDASGEDEVVTFARRIVGTRSHRCEIDAVFELA